MTNTTVTASDGRILTITDDSRETLDLTDGRIEYIAQPSYQLPDEWVFIPRALNSRKPGGRFFYQIGA